MSEKLSRNSLCPCGSGRKYKHCCIGKNFDWITTDEGQIVRQVPLSEETAELLESLRQAQIAKHGHQLDRVFEDAPPLEVMEHWTVEAMKHAGVEPALIHAFEKTGLLLNARNEANVTVVDVEEWEAAITEYEHQSGTKAACRRLNEEDLQRILRYGPKQ